MGQGRFLSVVVGAISICALALPASALADVTLEGENMTWPANSGSTYQESGTSGYRMKVNGTGHGTVTTTQPTALVSVRLRTSQSGLLCQGDPQFSLYVDGAKRAIWTLAASPSYSTFAIDVDAIGTFAVDPGSHDLAISLDNDQSTDLVPCDRDLYVDRLTLTTRPAQIFSSTTWRNAPLAANATLAADQTPVTRLGLQVQRFGTFVNDGDSYSVPVYTVRADQPTSSVIQDPRIVPSKYSGADADAWTNQMSAVPIPASAKASGPCDGQSDGETPASCNNRPWSDREIAIYQPSTDTLWEIYHLVKNNGQWVATDGGRITNVSTNSTVNYDPAPVGSTKHFGVAATRIPLLATLQRTREVITGQINHPVSIHVPHTTTGSQVLPALENDGDFTTDDDVKEGTRFRLPADYPVDSLQDPYLRAFARAVQNYGMIVTDKDCHNGQADPCSAVTTIVQDPAPTYGATGDPYGIDESNVLAGFPWSSLKVVAPTN